MILYIVIIFFSTCKSDLHVQFYCAVPISNLTSKGEMNAPPVLPPKMKSCTCTCCTQDKIKDHSVQVFSLYIAFDYYHKLMTYGSDERNSSLHCTKSSVSYLDTDYKSTWSYSIPIREVCSSNRSNMCTMRTCLTQNIIQNIKMKCYLKHSYRTITCTCTCTCTNTRKYTTHVQYMYM